MTKYALLPFVAALAALSAGCSPATLQAPYVPNPVLLGPVDRVGGHRAIPEGGLRSFEIEEDVPAKSTETTRVGGKLEVTRRIVGSRGGERAVTNALLGMTEGRSDRDVQVDEIAAGGYVYVAWVGMIAVARAERWVDVSGRVVQVRRGR